MDSVPQPEERGVSSSPVVEAIRRYPVKAMGGEPLTAVDVDHRGLAWDRWYAVVDEAGRFAAGKNSRRFRRRDPVFGYAAALRGGEVVVRRDEEEWKVGDPALDDALSAAMHVGVRVLPEGGVGHFDAGSVSVVGTASLRWCAEHFGVDTDPRRLRVNLLLATDEPFVEETWAGRELSVGSTTLRPAERIERCRVVDLAQDGVATTTPLLKALGGERELQLGVYLDVVAPGRIAVGDAVT